MKPRLQRGGTVGAKPKPVATAVLKNCICTSQGCASEIVWDAVSQTFVAGRLVGLKEFERHKLEDDRLHLASKLPPPSTSTVTESDDRRSSTARTAAPPDVRASRSTQRKQRQLCKGFNTLLELQEKLHASEIRLDQVRKTLNDLMFVHSPALYDDSCAPKKDVKDTPHTLNEGQYALLYNTPSNAPLIQYEEELLQLLHVGDSIVDYGDKELQDAKSALEDEVDHNIRNVQEVIEGQQ
ncbi:hypothetical protein C8R48DRAFT_677102 [Suillus tomentosus]|nr:hypothetical protein C8R48DRAFT_677102 [Suillus tomentosus]